VKDNIDVAGLPTTAACEAFKYYPTESAPTVQALLDAGEHLCSLYGPFTILTRQLFIALGSHMCPGRLITADRACLFPGYLALKV
jgi:hypothetical protein